MSGVEQVRDWWRTEIVDVADGSIRFRGYPVEQLMGNAGFAQTLWLLTRGEIPEPAQARLLEAAMVASMNAGPMSPSCAIASMAMTCGVGLNNAIASGINALGDTHGGAGQQVMERLVQISADAGAEDIDGAVERHLDAFFAAGNRFLPGFGHRFHSTDPRAVRMLELVRQAEQTGAVSGRFRRIALAIEASLGRRKGKAIPMNVDGAFGALLSELGFDPPLGRGVFVIARAVGLMAHAVETAAQGKRIKGPVPDNVMYTYAGPPPRDLPEGSP